MVAAFRQEQDALSIRHPFAVVLAPFIHVRRVGELPRVFSIHAS
jgi:hypothetical protein